MTAPGPVLRRDPAVHVERIAGHVVLYEPSSEALHLLDPPSSAVWDALDGVRDGPAVAAAVRARYPGAPPRLEGDVADVLVRLLADGVAVLPDPERG